MQFSHKENKGSQQKFYPIKVKQQMITISLPYSVIEQHLSLLDHFLLARLLDLGLASLRSLRHDPTAPILAQFVSTFVEVGASHFSNVLQRVAVLPGIYKLV